MIFGNSLANLLLRLPTELAETTVAYTIYLQHAYFGISVLTDVDYLGSVVSIDHGEIVGKGDQQVTLLYL